MSWSFGGIIFRRDSKSDALLFRSGIADEVLLARISPPTEAIVVEGRSTARTTIECAVTDISYIPIPGVALKTLRGVNNICSFHNR